MATRLQREIRQRKPFRSLEEEVYLNLLRTADALLRGSEERLKPAGLTPGQYNVLRILRGAGPRGLACGAIAERMLTRHPDITRLLDRLDARGLVTRARGARDRRVVLTRITMAGRKVLRELDEPVVRLHRGQLRHMGRRKLRQLIRLLEQARAAPGSPAARPLDPNAPQAK